MASQHQDKRIKLFLERRQERVSFDITQKAEEIYLPDGDPDEKLRRKIKTIADLSGDNYDQFTDGVTSVEGEQHPEDNPTLSIDATDPSHVMANKSEMESIPVAPAISAAAVTTTPASASTPANIRVASPQAIYAKLWHAQSEIGLALDVLNIIISSYQISTGNTSGLGVSGAGPMSTLPNATPTALPPGSLKCEYVPKAPLSLSTQISNEMMALGGKKHQLRTAADILMQGAQKLKKVMADESQFWTDALRLRKNNWCIVAAKGGAGQQPHHHHHGNRLASGSQLYVHYGFRDVGSLFNERAYAELVRSTLYTDSGSKKAKSVELHIPNKTGKIVVMSLVRQGAPHTQGSRIHIPRSTTLHSQLLDSQSTLFDNELFQELINEARTMSNSVSIVDNEIFLPVNDELELKIAYRTPILEDNIASPSASHSTIAVAETLYGNMKPESGTSLKRTADMLRCVIQLMQHRRYRQNIKERTESFFKGSRPGGGRAMGSFGQIQQTLQQRPTAMLSLTLQALQYYSFSRRIKESLSKVTRNIRQNWWEAIDVHTVDINTPPGMMPSATRRKTPTTAPGIFPPHKVSQSHGMGSAVSINLGNVAPAVRFVLRSHPVPCVVFQLSDRPSNPIMHVAEFEHVLEQELAARAIGRIREVLNSIRVWEESMPSLQSPEFVIDIDGQCLGVFQTLQRNVSGYMKAITVMLQLDMKTERAVSISLTCKEGGRSRQKRIYLEDQQLQGLQGLRTTGDTVHPYDNTTTILSSQMDAAGKTIEGFTEWLRKSILTEIEL